MAVGDAAGENNQGAQAISIGFASGAFDQGENAVALGPEAGKTNQGQNAIAIGYNAGYNNQPANSIVLNASSNELNGFTSGFYADPIRASTSSDYLVQYNSSTKELTYNATYQNNSFLSLSSSPPTSSTPGITGQMLLCDNILYIYAGQWLKIMQTTPVA